MQTSKQMRTHPLCFSLSFSILCHIRLRSIDILYNFKLGFSHDFPCFSSSLRLNFLAVLFCGVTTPWIGFHSDDCELQSQWLIDTMSGVQDPLPWINPMRMESTLIWCDYSGKWASTASVRFCLFSGQKIKYPIQFVHSYKWHFITIISRFTLSLSCSRINFQIQLEPFNLHLRILVFQCSQRKLVIPSPCHCVQIVIINIIIPKKFYTVFLGCSIIYGCLFRAFQDIQRPHKLAELGNFFSIII